MKDIRGFNKTSLRANNLTGWIRPIRFLNQFTWWSISILVKYLLERSYRYLEFSIVDCRDYLVQCYSALLFRGRAIRNSPQNIQKLEANLMDSRDMKRKSAGNIRKRAYMGEDEDRSTFNLKKCRTFKCFSTQNLYFYKNTKEYNKKYLNYSVLILCLIILDFKRSINNESGTSCGQCPLPYQTCDVCRHEQTLTLIRDVLVHHLFTPSLLALCLLRSVVPAFPLTVYRLR